jgi:hypothetical protein
LWLAARAKRKMQNAKVKMEEMTSGFAFCVLHFDFPREPMCGMYAARHTKKSTVPIVE